MKSLQYSGYKIESEQTGTLIKRVRDEQGVAAPD